MNIFKRIYYLIFNSSKVRYKKKNKVLLKGRLQKSDIKISGINNILILEEGSIFRKTKIRINGNNHTIVVGKNSIINRTSITMNGNEGDLLIGEKTSFGKVNFIIGEGKNVLIGKEALFSYNIEIRNTDSHPIFNKGENEILNKGKDIIIENHVWIGAGSKILKGVKIGEGAVIGGSSVVVKDVNPNTIVVGNPAKKVKDNIEWKVV